MKIAKRPESMGNPCPMEPALDYSFPGLTGDMERLRPALALALETAGWTAPDEVAIFNLACGRADETGVLLETAAPRATRRFYLGIDIRAAEIREARARWSPARRPADEIEFRHGDASLRMDGLPDFDLVFLRHQNFWTDAPVWTRIFRHAIGRLKADGLLMITSYFDHEHELATACLMDLGLHRLAELTNPRTRPLDDAPGKSVDRRIAVFGAGGLRSGGGRVIV